MPLVYACICPHPPVIVPEIGRGDEAESPRIIEAMHRVAGELAPYEPETAIVVSSHGPAKGQTMGILTAPQVGGDLARFGASQVRFDFETDQELAGRILEEAVADDVRLTGLRRWDGGLDWGCTVPLYFLKEALGGARLLPMTISWLEPRFHFELGRAIGRALEDYDRRVVFVCSVDLSHALTPGAPGGHDRAGSVFDERYRRTIDTWDVKWLVNLDSSFRSHAAEDAVPQTAILMGALSGYRIQPRVLSYESPFGVGYLVAAIDILGPR
jgi:aromatic ring-opening dioxygenase LigB subunit